MQQYAKKILFPLLLALTLGNTAIAANNNDKTAPIMLQEQGSFAVGGRVISTAGKFDHYNQLKPNPAGQTLHGDHAYVFYQKPVNARKYPLVFLHGAGQFSKTWESTPDGREGFQNIFLRRGYSVYLLDQPRRGDAGRSTVSATIEATTDDQFWFGIFRIGIWPNYFPNVQFPKDKQSLNQYFRQMTPNTGPFDINVIADAVAALFDKEGSGILVTHSQGGGVGWFAAVRSNNIKAIVSYEPGSNFVFPEGEVPAAMSSSAGLFEAVAIPLVDFKKLTKMPIVIYYGDYIPDKPVENPSQDQWRVRLAMAKLWVNTINKYGGDATLIHLPEIGIKGNTHFPFSDLNNIQIADLLSSFLKEKGLD